ncbi:MAG: pyocin knob domain-containing protein [Epibacterium sp.]
MSIPSFSAFPEIPQRSAPEADFDAKMYALFNHFATTHRTELLAFIQFLETSSTVIGAALNGTTIGLNTPAAGKFTDLEAQSIGGAAVQASLSDTTVGRLMLNGAHGLGAETRQVKSHDWNDADASGLFHTDSVGLNKPGFASNFAGISLRRSDTLHAQLAIALNSGVSQNARTAVRAKTGPTSWSDWFEIYTQTSILGTVAQSGGIPTGALIERGSNANGHYARFADGTQICHDRRSVSYATAQAMTATWIYPAPFSVNPQVSIAIDEDNLTNNATPSIYEVLSYFDSIGTSSVRLALGRISGMTSFSSGDTAGVDALAIGRWF